MKNYEPILIDLEQRSQEWHSYREGRIGASDAAAIMGVNPWTSKLQCWEEKVLGTRKTPTAAMERGNKYEAEALSWFNKQMQDFFTPATYQHGEHADIMASLDGWNDKVHVEIKIPSKLTSSIPNHYMPQLQHQMMVMGTDYGWYVEYDPNIQEGWCQKICRDEAYIQDLLAQELSFLTSMLDMKPPEPSDKDWATIVDPGLILAADEYKELCLKVAKLEELKESLKKRLIEGVNSNRAKCGSIKIQKILRKGTIDYQKMIEDYKITGQERYRKAPIETWRVQ